MTKALRALRHNTVRLSIPNADIDPAQQEMMHSLFDGRAHYKADQTSPQYHRDMARAEHRTESPKSKVTLADAFYPSYLA